jgi:predicted transcriptional regulator
MAETEPRSILDLPLDAAEEARLDAEADAEIEAGKGVPHERVREWLLKLARGETVPPPEA